MTFASPRFAGDARLAKAAANNPALKQGEPKCRAVEILQMALSDLGFAMPKSMKKPGHADGIFGDETARVLRAFQTKNGLTADGIAGKMTLTRLDAIYVARTAAARAAFHAEVRNPGRRSAFRTD